jgi:hypothetical protein
MGIYSEGGTGYSYYISPSCGFSVRCIKSEAGKKEMDLIENRYYRAG